MGNHLEGAFAFSDTREVLWKRRLIPTERNIMSNKVFVGGLAWATDDQALQIAFEPHGSVTEAKVISDRETGRSRGFGFVTFGDAEAATAAIAAMDGSELDGRTIRVNLAEDKPRRDNNRGGQRW